MNIFVLFGITGDLARKRIIPALINLYESSAVKGGTFHIGVGRKPEPISEFKSLPNSLYIQGDLDKEITFKKITAQIEKVLKLDNKKSSKLSESEAINIIFYSALPPNLHLGVANYIAKIVFSNIRQSKNKRNFNFKILIEKPIGNNLEQAKEIIDGINNLESKDLKINYVDHYLAKEALIDLQKLFYIQPSLLFKVLDPQKIKEIKAVIYDSKNIAGRGIFYDKVGALNDVGQNHLLQILSTIAGMVQVYSQNISAKHAKNPINKIAILKNLQIDGDPVFWQYKGYIKEKDVDPNSKTETYFSAKFRLKNSKFKISYIISAGKALDMDKSGIEIHYNDNSPSIFIDFKVEEKDAYEILFEKALLKETESSNSPKKTNINFFANKDEIIESWKIVERLKKLKTKANLVVYKKLHDIIG